MAEWCKIGLELLRLAGGRGTARCTKAASSITTVSSKKRRTRRNNASGFSETDRAKKLQSLGAGAYIRKPFLLENIGIAVKEELKKSAVI